ncbi:winged helix-turn-helix transcriptional regulator [Streptomyces chumphonensis]|uniref:Winged helix-turn-helix transcriptional regulator n=1 Tax=Streptomyces chumphonensis TaxID=1214925 RepID=A0A927IFH7_9ACTN|nr:metalloregulator ArsR/SmtB family transcription factor [Streptomyces chumphonensis]MBD3934441.1 winged helix-turn-helix transcriptional regulator [Streptomyces chumphonensis]
MDEVLGVRLMPPAELSNRDRARLLAPLLKVLADENRLTITLLLAEHSRTVKELQQATGLSQTLVSHHLATLRDQQLVTSAPRGRANVYTLCCEQLGTPVRWLASLAALTPEGAAACCKGEWPGE